MLVLASISGAAHELGDSSVHIVLHVRPIVLLSKRIVRKSLPGVSGYRQLMCEVQDECAECLWWRSLGGYANC